MKRIILTTLAACLALILAFSCIYRIWEPLPQVDTFKVGFLYENDESSPGVYNFDLAKEALAKEWGDGVQVLVKSNVLETETEEPLRELVRKGCRIVFVNSYTAQVPAVAKEYPEVQFCQVSSQATQVAALPDNFHTFNGEIYQGRYVSGIAAGMKLRELIDAGELSASQALVGFVGAFPNTEVISGYTAFLLGVRSVAPEAVMRVRYTNAWSSYSAEKACAAALIDEGCVVVAQHTNTIGPAVACEESAEAGRQVYHIGYNESMLDVATSTSLVSTRVNWIPYVTGAVAAVAAGRSIEASVVGNVHGTSDISAGFEHDWVQMLELNKPIAAPGTQEAMDAAVEAFRKGRLQVFKGDYTGVNPADASDTCDLSRGFSENRESSLPSFHYILDGVIEVEP